MGTLPCSRADKHKKGSLENSSALNVAEVGTLIPENVLWWEACLHPHRRKLRAEGGWLLFAPKSPRLGLQGGRGPDTQQDLAHPLRELLG